MVIPLVNLSIMQSMDEIDTWLAASILLKRYKGDAIFIATRRADALLDRGDVAGRSTWIRIAKAIAELERKALPADTMN